MTTDAATLERTETTDTSTTPVQEQPAGTLSDVTATAATPGSPPAVETPEAPAAAPAAVTPALDPEALRAEGAETERQKIAREAAEVKEREQREATNAELKALRTETDPLFTVAEETLDTYAESIPANVTRELRSLIRGLAANRQKLNLKSIDAAKLDLGDQAQAAAGRVEDLFMANFRASIDPAQREAFDQDVIEGKGMYSAVVKAAQKHAPRDAGTSSVADLITKAGELAADAKHNLTTEEQSAFGEALKGAKTPEAVLEALIVAGRSKGRSDPGGAPSGTERASNTTEPQSSREADDMFAGTHASGRKINLNELRAYRAKFK